MGRQIHFYLCPKMRAAIESEAKRIGVNLAGNYSSDKSAIQFSTSSGTDTYQGRLWTEAADPSHYELLCRAVKRGAAYDRDAALWVKHESRAGLRSTQQRSGALWMNWLLETGNTTLKSLAAGQ